MSVSIFRGLGRGLKKAVSYTTAAAAIGALASLGFEDISAAEGMRQVIVAGAPVALAVYQRNNNTFAVAEEYPILTPVVEAGLTAGLFYLGGRAMQALTGTEINHVFTSAAGAIGGAIDGVFASAVNTFLPGLKFHLEDEIESMLD